jgi:aryl-alcohol dehydrogenase-like predicted oxidoreductase
MTDPLKTRPLGNTGIELTELTLGTWGLFARAYGHVFPEQQDRTLETALKHGIRSFDLSPTWGEEGQSERAVAAAVGDRRNDMVYITRAGMVATDGAWSPDFSPSALRTSCERSLSRLATDRIDVWLLHNPSEGDLRREETAALAEALLQEGKIRSWGASVSRLDEAQAALDAGAQVLCLPFHLLAPRLVWDLEADLRARRVGLLARSTLGHGLLAGRWTARKRFTPDDHRTHRWSPEALAERVEQLNERRFLQQDPVLTMAQAAHRFVLAHDVVTSLVLGARTASQVEASLDAAGAVPYLPPEDLNRLRGMNE